MRRLLSASVLVTLAWSSVWEYTHAGGQERAGRITLAVLRSDGLLLPFAAFNGENWSVPWPVTFTGREFPVNLAAVPNAWWGGEAPAEWRLWQPGSQSGVPVRLLAPAVTVIGALRRLGIRTDHKVAPSRVPPFELPYPKEGLVVGGDAVLEPITSVSARAPRSQELARQLRPQMDAAEERTIRALRAQARWTHPFDKAARARVAAQLEAWYTTVLNEPGFRASYIEAVKKYPPQPEDQGCGLETFFSGWVHHNEQTAALKTEVKAVVSYCDRERVSYMLPFGALRLRNRTQWIVQMSGHDHEWYAVVEVTPNRTRHVAEYPAGRVFGP
jgi:hypothetical protein